MNLSKRLSIIQRFAKKVLLKVRVCLPAQKSSTFGRALDKAGSGIGAVYVINLERQPERWKDIRSELSRILDADGASLARRAIRVSACDALLMSSREFNSELIDPYYSLGDQLYVEPQPLAVPEDFDLQKPIRMTNAEIAVATSHIRVWQKIAQSGNAYSLILEDDVWFERGFAKSLDAAWQEMQEADNGDPAFDIFYISFSEVRHGAPKALVSANVIRPERGLWFLSGYVLSRKGAQALLTMLPCAGPVDLWINHKFRELDVRALPRSKANQRPDLVSTNSYSVLPTLSRIGILDHGDAALFHRRPVHSPVFAFGPPSSGLSALAMALSMLGYRCCSDYLTLPKSELQSLLAGRPDRVFDAYVNIGVLENEIGALKSLYPAAKFIQLENFNGVAGNDCSESYATSDREGTLHLAGNGGADWRRLCEYLNTAPPIEPFPAIKDRGQRVLNSMPAMPSTERKIKWLRNDPSPWIADLRKNWSGLDAARADQDVLSERRKIQFTDGFDSSLDQRWSIRTDTFPGNLGLFRPSNVVVIPSVGLSLSVEEATLGVRALSAGAISSRSEFLYGRFEAELKAVDVAGIITGFFLHRNSPRQEIDIEICGKRPDRLLVNVFYNPGVDGTRYDYGYRGTPAVIDLGFDASRDIHCYAIEWDPSEIRWFVDGVLVHRRGNWSPTPIPQLPMTLHFNTWPTRSQALAGRLVRRRLPASSKLRQISVNACQPFPS